MKNKSIVKVTVLVDRNVHHEAKLAMLMRDTSFQREIIKLLESWAKKTGHLARLKTENTRTR